MQANCHAAGTQATVQLINWLARLQLVTSTALCAAFLDVVTQGFQPIVTPKDPLPADPC